MDSGILHWMAQGMGNHMKQCAVHNSINEILHLGRQLDQISSHPYVSGYSWEQHEAVTNEESFD